MNNIEISLPNEKQGGSDFIRKMVNKESNTSDFARFLGIKEFTYGDKFRTSFYLTLNKNKEYDWVHSLEGSFTNLHDNQGYCGIRPVISNIPDDEANISMVDGLKEVSYGEYPQEIVDGYLNDFLEFSYQNGSLAKTNKSYTVDSTQFDDCDGFLPDYYSEYEFDGKKYIRVVPNSKSRKAIFSNGKSADSYNYIWFSVSPIKWIYDENENNFISKDVLVSGIKVDSIRNNYQNSDVKMYLNRYFINEIIPSNEITKVSGETMSFDDYLKEKKEQESGDEELTNEEMEQAKENFKMQREEKEKMKKENEKRRERMRNPYNLNFNKISEEEMIKGAIDSDIPVFLHGASSEGKSARVKQFDSDCVIIYLRNATPESLNGKSVYNATTGEMIDVMPSWLKKINEKCENEPDKLHIVFLDELTNALPSIQGIAFNIVLDKEVNGIWKLPSNARIVAAGNDMKDSLAANQMAEPLFNRFAHVYIKTTVENWLKWASTHNIHPAIYSFIAFKRDKVLRSEYDGEKPNADPRKWEMASKMLYSTENPEMLRSLVGEEITKEFVAFCRQRVITLEDVLNDNYSKGDIEMLNTSERYATVMGLSRVDDENLSKARNFAFEMGPEFRKIFDALWCHGDEEKMEKILESNMENGVRK